MTRAEVVDMVTFQCEDNYGEDISVEDVKENWKALVSALQSEGELPMGYKMITRQEVMKILRRVD